MDNRKIVKRFFFISQYEKEETFLEEMASKGWNLVSVDRCILRQKYEFELCECKDFIYKIEYIKDDEAGEYCENMKKSGWSEIGAIDGVYGKWFYFSIKRDIAETVVTSDESRLESLNRIIESYYDFYMFILTWQVIIIISSINAMNLGIFQKYSSIVIMVICFIASVIVIVEMAKLFRNRNNLNKEVAK